MLEQLTLVGVHMFKFVCYFSLRLPMSTPPKPPYTSLIALLNPCTMWNPQPCRDPPPEMLEQLTLDGVRGVLEAQLHPTNLELNVAGDFDPEELEALVLRYLGELWVILFCRFMCF
jgi:hypothetical protein